jgi:hypothetical protein
LKSLGQIRWPMSSFSLSSSSCFTSNPFPKTSLGTGWYSRGRGEAFQTISQPPGIQRRLLDERQRSQWPIPPSDLKIKHKYCKIKDEEQERSLM